MSTPMLFSASSKRSISARETSCSVLRNQMMKIRSLSVGSLPLSASLIKSSIWAFVCFLMSSSSWKKLSSWRSLIPCSRDVAMFMCISSNALRSLSSGSNVMAALRCCADAVVSFCRSSMEFAPVFLVTSAASSRYLVSSVSMSSATCGKGTPAFLFQKKSFCVRS